MTTKELASHVMQMRDLQIQYFASGKPRFRDKKILAASKAKEAEVDSLLGQILHPEPVQRKDEYVPSYFEQNAIFGNETDSDPYAP